MLTLPDARQDSGAEPLSGGTRGASGDRRLPLVLLVDDAPTDTSLYREHLVAAGFRVLTATNGMEGLALARSMAVDLVVLDLEMPGIDGWEAAGLLSRDERTRSLPILALSGHCETEDVMRAIAAGCARFVPKPCLASELERAIRWTLELSVR
jgi:CheY-like chemotaxis protein